MLYPHVAGCSFRRHAAYPVSGVFEALTNTLFGFVRASIMTALWTARPSLGGYGVADAVTFSFLTQALIGPIQVFGGIELVERIRSGDVAVDLLRPAGLQRWWLADDLGRAASLLVVRGAWPLAIGALFFPMTWPDPAGAAAFAVSLVLAVLVSFALRYLVALSMFWLHDDRGVAAVSLVTTMFFSGMIVPLVIFPGGLGAAARLLPWSALLQVPADVYLGKADVPSALAFQAAWAAVLLLAGHGGTALARRKLVVQGG